MNTLKILGIATISLMVSCTQKEKNPKVDPTQKSDSMTVQTPATSDNSKNSLDWHGTYEAVVPCADCPGIKTTLTLNENKSFKLEEEYLEKKARNEDQGTFQWDPSGSVITLNGNVAKYKYKVGENTITQLDTNGQPIDGPNKNLYIFKKK
jgi:uncharacterized lipoprotein NlpE involved in copper resistance